MAVDDPMNDDEEIPQGHRSKGSSMLLTVVIVILAFVLAVAASVGATLYVTGMFSGEHAAASADEGHEDKPAHKKKKTGKKAVKDPPIYVELGDPFVVNFIEGEQIRYLQVKIEVMTREPDVSEDIEAHMPVIRNNLVFLFSGLDFATLTSIDGKQKIRDEALAEVQGILKKETGRPGVEALYFTSFVMQ